MNITTKEQIEELISNRVTEGVNIEYKETIPELNDRGRKEFLADVSSFANTSGGTIIYGVIEEDGFIKEFRNITTISVDKLILTLESLLRDGLEPRITCQIRPIIYSPSCTLIVINIQKSLSRPHRVTFAGHNDFYGRGSANKYPLNTEQLKRAFIGSESEVDKVRNFRKNRLSEILNDDTPVPLIEGRRLVIHYIPFNTFTLIDKLTVKELNGFESLPRPMGSSGYSKSVNMDGVVVYSRVSTTSIAYNQFFRNCSIESVLDINSYDFKDKTLPILSIEEEGLENTKRVINYYKDLSITTPIYIFMSLLDIKGSYLDMSGKFIFNEKKKFERDNLLCSEVTIQSYEDNISSLLKTSFDHIWNAFGFESSMSYNLEGEWTGKI